jgi:predicted ester cyclase
MRLAIPDIRCAIEQMIVAGDRVLTHLYFSGHFTGRFGQIQGQGQTIDFIATEFTASLIDASLKIGTSKTT